ncbi:aminotransferase class I/II-fold pyridoxal phosphate-dependent enzyme [Jatrophihabitans telluris]|uniref:Aminotransferase class I/II-fold pyridoxal phosphate-dependent enzyme n=1 Tax=Jatrophihabitans telluris TaxID=2038343 RepID=A0ABY4QV77_9ACTN|nr:aminotransferase class I/II-fold pyridoxal phosphate-dependent enzyme [Jatrophihabitans telluris]UQX87370.1 aminotransferase class I/II-fold pyridoxal phosphate-dependent enzyme [Jatrophihabitans telluris]
MASIQYRPIGHTAKDIAADVETAVRDGRLSPGEPLPPVRSLATELGLAPGTVAAAYGQLRERGLVETRGRRGTFVRPRPPIATRSQPQPGHAGALDLASGQPDPRLLPKLNPGPLRHRSPAAAPQEFVLPELREQARDRLVRDGVPAEWISVTSGGLDAIGRVLSAHLRAGDTVAVEDPGWPNALDLIATMGLRVLPLELDAAGIRPEGLTRALHAGARALIVTNRAQNPTGSYLTAERARQLRAVLGDHPDTLVVEDDHAGELATAGLATLAGATESWGFIRSASKPYGPDLRVGTLTGDETTVARVEGRMRTTSGWVSLLLQQLLLNLWTSERTGTVIRRARHAYDDRRLGLVSALTDRGLSATGASGLNVWVAVADETAVVTGLLAGGWSVAAGSRFRQRSAPGIRITVSNLDLAQLDRLADDVAEACGSATNAATGGYSV